jgi:ADP-ribosylglycohydrolase
MAGWTHLSRLLELEVAQRAEEGCPVDAKEWRERISQRQSKDVKTLEALYDELTALQPPRDFPFEEPTDLEAIRSLRPNGARDMGKTLGDRELFERVHGGWIGRCCGCSLGRPFATQPFTDHPEGGQRHAIRRWLEGADAWPLENYVPASSRAFFHGLKIACPESARDSIRGVEPDDNVNAMLVALKTLEDYGTDFQTCDVAQTWLERLTFDALAMAETQVFVALVNDERFVRRGRSRQEIEKIDWLGISTRRNPFREWIGAMRRADVYGYVSPGRPEQAAELAWRDARISHVKNGVYGSMFVAATIAGAFFEKDPYKLIDVGLSEIPAHSRLAGAVRRCLKACELYMDWEDCWDHVLRPYRDTSVDHVIPNALICVMALHYGGGDFTRTIGIAACSGLNPNANAATVGSILGVALGHRALPLQWVSPLLNTLKSNVLGYTRGTITEGARRTMKVLLPEESPAEA